MSGEIKRKGKIKRRPGTGQAASTTASYPPVEEQICAARVVAVGRAKDVVGPDVRDEVVVDADPALAGLCAGVDVGVAVRVQDVQGVVAARGGQSMVVEC